MSFLNRRRVFATLLAASSAAPALAGAAPVKLRVVYHLADLDKVNFVSAICKTI